MPGPSLWETTKASVSQFMAHNAMQMSAALAFYVALALAPTLVIVINVAGFFVEPGTVEDDIVEHVQEVAGPEAAGLVETVIAEEDDVGEGVFGLIVGVVVILAGATGVFVQLKASLNTIWEKQPPSGQALWQVARDRMLAFAMLLGLGVLLVATQLLGGAVVVLAQYIQETLGISYWIVNVLHKIFAFGVLTLVFAALFRILPDHDAELRSLWVGCAVTAALFVLGEIAVSVYLSQADLASGYGAAGSVIVLLMWLYYSAVMLFLGAEFTHEYAKRYDDHE